MKLSRNARKFWGYALASALVLTAAAWPSVQKTSAAGEKFYWCGKEQKNITVLETEANTPNEITFTEGSSNMNLGYSYIDNVDKTWNVTDVVATINGEYQFAIADSISSEAGKADNAEGENDRQKLDLPHVWGGYDASKFPMTAKNNENAKLSVTANTAFVLTVSDTKTDITSISISFKSTWLSQSAPIPTKSPDELAKTFFYCDNEMEDINVLDTPATTPNKVRVTTTDKQNMGWVYIGSATKEWSISNVVLKVNDKYFFDIDGKTSKPDKINSTSTENNCQKIELPNIWNTYISTKLTEKFEKDSATFEKVTTGEGDNAQTSFVLTANGEAVTISKFAITFETTALSQPSFVDDMPTPAPGVPTPTPAPGVPTPTPGGDATPTPAPGGDATPTPAPGGETTPTPAPGGDTTPTPAPGGDTTPTPGGDATPTPAPGGDATPTPAPGGDTSTPTPAPGGNTSPTPAPGGDNTPTTVGLAKNAKATVGNFTYKVTKTSVKSAGKVTKGTVTVTAMSKKGKKAKKLSVPATVKAGGATYNVTAVGAKAMKGAKATSVTLGKNVKSIGKSAFASCKKLSKLSIKAKLSSVAKGAFKGCKKKIKVSGTAKKQNVKKLKKSGYKKFK